MKVNRVNNNTSFRQSFVHPTLKNIAKENQIKLPLSYAFGQLYPMDILFGGTPMGNLTIRMSRSSLWDFLTINELIPVTNKNMISYYISKNLERLGNLLYSKNNPIENFVIKDLNNKTELDIAYEINDKIKEYNKKYEKKFSN